MCEQGVYLHLSFSKTLCDWKLVRQFPSYINIKSLYNISYYNDVMCQLVYNYYILQYDSS